LSVLFDLIIYITITIIFAVIRGGSLFIPVFYGIAVGILTGKINKHLHKRYQFDLNGKGNIFKTIIATTIYILINLFVVGTLRSSPDGNCISWLADIIQGYTSEPFLSISRYRGILVKENLKNGFWLLFMILDALFYAFAFMLAHGPDLPIKKNNTVR